MAKEFQRGTFPVVSKYARLPREPYRAPIEQPVCEYPEVLVDTVVIPKLQTKGEVKPSKVKMLLVALFNAVKPHLVEAAMLTVRTIVITLALIVFFTVFGFLFYYFLVFLTWARPNLLGL